MGDGWDRRRPALGVVPGPSLGTGVGGCRSDMSEREPSDSTLGVSVGDRTGRLGRGSVVETIYFVVDSKIFRDGGGADTVCHKRPPSPCLPVTPSRVVGGVSAHYNHFGRP